MEKQLPLNKNYLKIALITTIVVLIIVFILLLIYFTPFRVENMNNESMGKNNDIVLPNVYKFYKGTPKKGIYINYLKKISKFCLKYIKKKEFKIIKNKAIIVDFDDTLVWTNPIDFSPLKFKNTKKYGKVFSFPVLYPINNLLKQARKLGYYIFIITARPPGTILSTIYNAEKYKIPYDSIFTSIVSREHPTFKSKIREKIEKHNPKELKNLNTFELLSKKTNKSNTNNTNIILTIGDSWYDILKGHRDIGVKLPSPDDFNSYVYYKNQVVELI